VLFRSLTVFLDHEKRPFFGGTYFPPGDDRGHAGLVSILRQVARQWRRDRGELSQFGEELAAAIRSAGATQAASGYDAATIAAAVERFAQRYDPLFGGFTDAMKFPMGHVYSFLIDHWRHTHEMKTRIMVEESLDHMLRGGIYDHIGGGFHRYSTDPQWLVPHFEKMLYDQALLVRTFTEAYQAFGNNLFARIATQTAAYVLRDMRHPEGAFFSAEDADSDGREGGFYLWTEPEIIDVLGQQDGREFCALFGVSVQGTFDSKSILAFQRRYEFAARDLNMTVSQLTHRIDRWRRALLEVRNRRQRPFRDEKILTDWNGLMIAALAYAGRTLGMAEYCEAGAAAARFVLRAMRDGQGGLYKRWRDGEPRYAGMLDDYAFFAWGLLELYEATFDPAWLAAGLEISRMLISLFEDPAEGGFFMTAQGAEALPARPKAVFDGSIPAGNSVALLVCGRLAALTGDPLWRRHAENGLAYLARCKDLDPSAVPLALIALDRLIGPSKTLIIAAGEQDEGEVRPMLDFVNHAFLPRLAVICASPLQARRLVEYAPIMREKRPLHGKAVFYICTESACLEPVQEWMEAKEMLLREAA
jgi:uncharacterized protein YyaL (SSP411 family)